MRDKRIKAGRCANCGVPREGKSKRFCDACLGDVTARTEELRKEREDDGTCTRCGGARDVPTSNRCRACIDRSNEYVKAFYERNPQKKVEYKLRWCSPSETAKRMACVPDGTHV